MTVGKTLAKVAGGNTEEDKTLRRLREAQVAHLQAEKARTTTLLATQRALLGQVDAGQMSVSDAIGQLEGALMTLWELKKA